MEIKLKSSKYIIQVNKKEIIKNLFDLNIGTVLTEIIKVDETIDTKAFLLLYKSIRSTNIELSKVLGQDILDANQDLVFNVKAMENDLEDFLEQEVTITKDFFNNIVKSNKNYLSKSYILFRRYLENVKIFVPENYEYTYYGTFRKNLSDEFQQNKESYKELVEYFDNPVFEENASFVKLLEYYENIKSFYINPLQPEIAECKESLKDLYIEPFFKIYKNNLKNQYDEDFVMCNPEISIHEFINKYFFKGLKFGDCNQAYNMLFLLGQPGQGKTSLCYKLLYDYLNENYGMPNNPIYFIKIRDLVAKDFIDSTFPTLNKYLKQDIDFDSDSCVLVLDGLDEAYMGGGINDNDLKVLYERLNKATQNNLGLKIILTSRVNYLKVNEACLDKSLVVQLSVLTNNQILEYAKKFKILYPKNLFVKQIKSILKDEKYEHIRELLQQAVLIYFIAISDINIEDKDSKTKIYNKIFNSLAKRSWDRNGQLSYINKKIKDKPNLYEKTLRDYIRNIAFEIYQSPNLYITIDTLANLKTTETFIRKCFNEDLISSEKLKDINKYLLISFYFQESKKNSTTENTIEFFHNSLWEFLTSEYMWEENKKLLLNKDEDEDYFRISKEEYFELLNRLVGEKELSKVLKQNIIDLILNEDLSVVKDVFLQSKKIFYELLQMDFLLEYKWEKGCLSPYRKSSNIFQLMWIFVYYSGERIEASMNITAKMCDYMFKMSNRNLDYSLKNIVFDEDIFDVSFDSVNMSNVMFDDYVAIYNTNFDSCQIENSTLKSFCGNALFIETKFINVIFDFEIILGEVVFVRNTFINCQFVKIHIPNKSWYENFLKNNDFDEFTLENIELKETSVEPDFDDSSYIRFEICNKNIQ